MGRVRFERDSGFRQEIYSLPRLSSSVACPKKQPCNLSPHGCIFMWFLFDFIFNELAEESSQTRKSSENAKKERFCLTASLPVSLPASMYSGILYKASDSLLG